MELRDYQQAGIDAILDALGRGVRRQLLVAATGAGKTVLFAYLVNQYLARGARALVLAHRDRLIRQAADKIRKFVSWSQIGIVMADQNRLHAPCVIASVQTLARQRRLAVMPQFDLVIVDECHRSTAKTYQRILAHVCDSETLRLGVTATPSRSDGIGLDKVYDEIVYQVGILDLIERGYLVPLRGQRITIEADFSKLKTQKNADGVSDYKADEVAEIMDKANWYEKAAEGWFKYAADRRTLAFTPRVAMAHQLAEYMRGQGVRAIALDGSTPQGVQRQALSTFERGEVQFLASCDLLTEGVDLPSANCALLARPTKSLTIYSQTVGRITRLSPETGKIDGLVLDMVGSTKRFDLVTLGDLFGLRSLKDGEDVREAKKREQKEDEEAAAEQLELPELAEGEVVGREVNLFERRQPIGKPPFEWEINTEAKRSRLKAAGHTFEIWREGSSAWYGFTDMHWQGFIQGRTTDYREARAKIEAEARRLIYGPWANDPASEKQIKLLTRNKIQFRPNITKAEAKELLQPIFDRIDRAKKARATA
ncbi:MAG TPA: DEAD/DEAH box helicase [Blastocatellia bacterium]|jgi:superfamily II DNA or RNA helicase